MSRIRTKACDRCQVLAGIMYRIRVDKFDLWQFVCQPCWTSISHDYPDYIYGGTWKSQKR
jgi:hypothetical protein